jgi:hypothetical protein
MISSKSINFWQKINEYQKVGLGWWIGMAKAADKLSNVPIGGAPFY